VDRLLQAARAGALLATARRAWEERQDWESVQLDLEEVLTMARENTEAEEIAGEAQRLKSFLSQQRQSQAAIQAELSAARLALAGNDPDTAQAKVNAVLGKDSRHPEALALQEEIQKTYKARDWIREARAARDAGKYDEALALVDAVLKTVLPDYPDAVALRQQIEAGRQANEALLQAEIHARHGEFQQARQALRLAAERGADPDRVRQVQGQVEELRRKWETDTVFPIRTLSREGKYPEALSQCKQALDRAASPDFELELKDLQADIVNRWVEKDLAAIRGQLQQAADEMAFTAIAADLDRLAALGPADHLMRQITELRQQIETGRQANAALRLVDVLAHRGEFQQARQTLQQAEEYGARPDRVQEVRLLVENGEEKDRLKHRLEVVRQKTKDGKWQIASNEIKGIRKDAERLKVRNIILEVTALVVCQR
jgi:tetratricopeptide (TPR) repeat protein